MEKFIYDPRLSQEQASLRLPNWTKADFDLIGSYVDDIGTESLEPMKNPQTALEAWGIAFTMLRDFPATSFMGAKTMEDFPQITEDLSKRGPEFHRWLVGKLNDENSRYDLLDRVKTRTVTHTLELMGRLGIKIDDKIKQELEQDFGNPDVQTQRTKWFSMLFNGMQITTVECFIEEEYFEVV